MIANRYERIEPESETAHVLCAREPCTVPAVQGRLLFHKERTHIGTKTLMDRTVIRGLLMIEHARSPRRAAVVESKGALITGRAKHISSRSIPKTAKLGIFGFLVLLVIVFVLLPTAKATSRLSQPAVPVAASSTPVTPSQELSGRIVDQNGRPVVGAQVGVNTGEYQIMLHNGIIELGYGYLGGERIIKTDPQGWFRFSEKPPDPFYLFAAHEVGFALVSGKEFRKNQEIRLGRWGRVEGQLAKSGEGLDHRIWMKALPNPAWQAQRHAFLYDAPYDADGRFVFEKVPPGWFEAGYLVAIEEDYEGFTSRTPVAVKAGETTTVKVGGQGRPVIGRFLPPPSYRESVYFGKGRRALRGTEKIDHIQDRWRQWEQTSERDVYIPRPAALGPATPDYCIDTVGNQRKWYRCDVLEDANDVGAVIWNDVNWRGYAFRINPDGSFRIDDVVPGKYDLRVTLSDKDSVSMGPEEPFAEYRGVIEVPPMTEATTDQPLDLGNLTLDVHGVGQMAPLFQAETVDGKSIRLIDYRGKFVLLHWETDISYVDRFKELQKTYGDAGNLQIIGINLYDSLETIRTYVAQHKIEWPQIQPYGGRSKGIFGQYDMSRLPYIVLVDPKGKIAFAGLVLSGERLARIVREAIGRGPSRVNPQINN